jgi:hypothetical protein
MADIWLRKSRSDQWRWTNWRRGIQLSGDCGSSGHRFAFGLMRISPDAHFTSIGLVLLTGSDIVCTQKLVDFVLERTWRGI